MSISRPVLSRLAGRKTKSGRARSFPFRVFADLDALVARGCRTQTDAAQRTGERIIPHVFHDEGGHPLFGADQKPKKSFRRAWRRACLAAGLPGRIPHDFRRTAVRNLERAAVPRSVAMELIGHKTESVYQRGMTSWPSATNRRSGSLRFAVEGCEMILSETRLRFDFQLAVLGALSRTLGR